MNINYLETLSFQDKVKMLPEIDKWYLTGFVDHALKGQINKLEQAHKASAGHPA